MIENISPLWIRDFILFFYSSSFLACSLMIIDLIVFGLSQWLNPKPEKPSLINCEDTYFQNFGNRDSLISQYIHCNLIFLVIKILNSSHNFNTNRVFDKTFSGKWRIIFRRLAAQYFISWVMNKTQLSSTWVWNK